MIVAIALVSLLCALIPAAMMIANLRLYTPPPPLDLPPQTEIHPRLKLQPVSILIPARNEAAGIADAVRAALATRGIPFEVVVLDDASTDNTAEIVREIAAIDPRVRLKQSSQLPPGWNGKQHACWLLAVHARAFPVLCFVDADVRLTPDCIARMALFLDQSNSALVSGFPRQITRTFLEWLLLPLIHFVLLGFLPIARMRAGTDPAYAAGCGQFLMVRRDKYLAIKGHGAIRQTMHDGLLLPRLFRQHNYRTDLADLTDLATCRMYHSASEVWSGLAKNATEGLATPTRILPATLLLLLGQVFPIFFFLLLVFTLLSNPQFILLLTHHAFVVGITRQGALTLSAMLCAALLAYVPRILGARRFHQDWRSVLLHPLGILMLLAIQWYALARKLTGRRVSWRNRSYPGAGGL